MVRQTKGSCSSYPGAWIHWSFKAENILCDEGNTIKSPQYQPQILPFWPHGKLHWLWGKEYTSAIKSTKNLWSQRSVLSWFFTKNVTVNWLGGESRTLGNVQIITIEGWQKAKNKGKDNFRKSFAESISIEVLTTAVAKHLIFATITYIWAYKSVQIKSNDNLDFVIDPEMLSKVEYMIGTFKCHWSAFYFDHGVIREIME